MLFMTSFRQYIFFLFPLLCIVHTITMYQLNEVSEREKEGIVDEENKQDSDVSSHVMRDLAYFVFCTYGLYCYSRTLVTRFITYEKSQLQQAYLTNLFDQQKDGLVVLKPRPPSKEEQLSEAN